jgi:hypothetical protein
MKLYGKLVEFKASLFHAICPFQLSIGRNDPIPIRWNTDPEDIEVYDTDIYSYVGTNPFQVTCKLTGWYDVRASINFEQTSGGNRSNVFGYVSKDEGNGFEIIQKTFSYAYVRNTSARYGTIVISQPIKITQPNTALQLLVNRQNINSSIFVRQGEASIFLQRLRPLQDTGR